MTSRTIDPDLERRAVATARGLAMDAVLAAGSGHTGTALSLAPLAHVLFGRVMRYDADAPDWFDRDRFVLSAGHASMLQYAYLHLAGFGLGLEELREFRQWGSRTPGHPELGHTPGVEVTTGPLGQGIANAVGMAMAERHLRAVYGADVCDHRTWCIAGDGDLMEGVSHEAASLAGHQGLGRLVVVYDDNRITIDGRTDLALGDDAAGRFRSYGWDVVELGDVGEDLDALEAALRGASEVEDRPSLLVLRTTIGRSLPRSADTPKAHGAITDGDEIAEAKVALGLDPDVTFAVPDDVADAYRSLGRRGADDRHAWERRLASWDGPRDRFDAALAGTGLDGWADVLPSHDPGGSVATRKASGAALAALADVVPGLVAGSADLTGNTGTQMTDAVMDADHPAGRQVHYGVREHAMAAAMNGMAAHGGVLPVGGTFLVFSDYLRPALRLAALTGSKVIYSFTHDSVGVGEDGPTHQPVEHVAALRSIPGLRVIRPADANEVAEAWRQAVEHDGPTALILTRQDVPVLEGTGTGLASGAYELGEVPDPDVVLVGTGSEVQHCVTAATTLDTAGIRARVVSMPSWDLFEAAGAEHREALLPPDVPVVSLEAGVTFGWERWADLPLGIDRFGASAPGDRVMTELGMTAEHVVAAVTELLTD